MTVPWILGHRGSPRVATENTLPSFRAALGEGADGVELDVRICATGELVVCHDATLERLAHARVRVAATGLEALQRYDLGGGSHVPMLDEVLAIMDGRVVNVEIKTDDGDPAALARATADVLARAGRRLHQAIVSSFDPEALVALRRIDPRIPRGLLLSDEPAERDAALARVREVLPAAMHPHWSLCSPERVRGWKAQGLRVNVWTVDQADEARRLAALGVDAVITNVPAVIRAALTTP